LELNVMMTNIKPIPTRPAAVHMTLEFFELLDTCEALAKELADPASKPYRQTLYIRLADDLAGIEAEQEKPLTQQQVDSLTVAELIATQPQYIAGNSALLRQYCSALTKVLRAQQQTSEVNDTLNALLCKMVNLLIDDLLTPRPAKAD
jgi:hypothetical protein